MILCSGAFDGLHAGHIRYLRAARDVDPSQMLRVAIAPDTYISSAKGRVPFWSQEDRAITVWAVDCVDGVIIQHDDTVAQVIINYRPRYLVKGADWRGRLPTDVKAACHEVGAEIVYVDTPGRHVSEARC